MTSGPNSQTIPPRTDGKPLRLRLKPKDSAAGYVDGGWWPRSHDLAAELPALAEVLAVRLGKIHRVAFALPAWNATPRKLKVDGFRVRLEGFGYQDKMIVHVTGANRGKISLLVVPPETAEQAGHDALLTAGRRDNADRPEEILAAVGVPTQRWTGDRAEDRWENHGGQITSRG